jgi:hypothetical protein
LRGKIFSEPKRYCAEFAPQEIIFLKKNSFAFTRRKVWRKILSAVLRGKIFDSFAPENTS